MSAIPLIIQPAAPKVCSDCILYGIWVFGYLQIVNSVEFTCSHSHVQCRNVYTEFDSEIAAK